MRGMEYNVDIVMCIDCTYSMHGILDTIKSNGLKFYDDVMAAFKRNQKAVETLRVRVIAYRDFYNDGKLALSETEFLTLPDQNSIFQEFVNGLYPSGGGDEPESGLEALALAIKSSWNVGTKKRQIIVIWTDASAHPLEDAASKKVATYPDGMPANFDEITEMWDDGQEYLSGNAKRLIIFSPDSYPWTDIANHWENCIHYPSKAGDGLSDVDYNTIIELIQRSV